MKNIILSKFPEILDLLKKVSNFLIEEKENANYQIFKKEDDTLLTTSDIKSDLMIKAELYNIFGQVAIISEESEEFENEKNLNEKYCFLLDPLDGTKAFINDSSFSINLSFCINGMAIFSFIAIPLQNTIYFNTETEVFKLKNDEIITINLNMNKQDVVIGQSSSEDKNFMIKIEDIIKNKNIKILPAGAKFTYLLENGELLLSKGFKKSWDIIPFLPILDILKIQYFGEENKIFLTHKPNNIFFASQNLELFEKLLEKYGRSAV